MNDWLKNVSGNMRCNYEHCRVEMFSHEAATLKVELDGVSKQYKGHQGCMEALEEELRSKYGS